MIVNAVKTKTCGQPWDSSLRRIEDMLQKGHEEGAMSSLRKAHPLFSHAYYKECESFATSRYRTQLWGLCSVP